MLKEYYGQQINKLTEAVIHHDEEKVKEILDTCSEEEINSGTSPLYYISFTSLLEKDWYEKKRRIFKMILDHPKFTNVNNDIVRSELVKEPLLFHYLKEAGINEYSEMCAIDLINSEKYTRINDIDGPRTLTSAIYGNYSFREDYRYSMRCIMEIINQPNFNNIGNKIFTNPMTPKYKMSSLDVPSINHDTVKYIVFHDKFDSMMLVQNIKKLSVKLSSEELYELIMIKGIPDNIKVRDNIMIKALETGNLGVILSFIDRDDILFSDDFYNLYYSSLRNNLDNIFESVELVDYIIRGIDHKHLLQYNNKVLIKS